jgi:3-hydroxyisobutyrate dehydrogenase
MADFKKPVVAILGTGTMGLGMARNALRAGFEVRAWNRTRERAEPLAADGAAIASSAGEAAAGADLVVTMLSDADAVLDVAGGDDGALAAAGGGALWVQTSTIGLDGFDRCAELADRRGVPLVDAPVLGTKQPAEEGKLVVLASGPDDARERCDPFFEAVGQRTLWLGPVGAGTRLKLVVNTWIVTVVEGLAETLALADALEVPSESFLEAVDEGPLDLPYARMKGRMMIERSFEPSFALSLAAKDARLVAEAAERCGVDLPLPRLVAERMARGVEEGHGDEDLAATYLTSAPG